MVNPLRKWWQFSEASDGFCRCIWLWTKTSQKAQLKSLKWKRPKILKYTQGEEASTAVVKTYWHLQMSGMQQYYCFLSYDLIVNFSFHGCSSGTIHPAINLREMVNIYFKRKHLRTVKSMKSWASTSAGINQGGSTVSRTALLQMCTGLLLKVMFYFKAQGCSVCCFFFSLILMNCMLKSMSLAFFFFFKKLF